MVYVVHIYMFRNHNSLEHKFTDMTVIGDYIQSPLYSLSPKRRNGFFGHYL